MITIIKLWESGKETGMETATANRNKGLMSRDESLASNWNQGTRNQPHRGLFSNSSYFNAFI